MTSEPDSATPFTALTGGLETEGYRERPRNVEAEQAVLGAVLVNNETLNRVSEIVQPTHFHEPAHQRIYEAALKLVDRGQLASPVTLRHFFEQDQSLAQVGGAQYLARLAGAAVTLYEVEHYARVVQDLALRRDLITIAEEMMHEAHVPDVDDSAGEQIERAEQQLFQLAETGQADRGFIDFAQAVREAIEMADAAYKRDTLLVGVPTGLTDLDQRLGGLHRSDLLILAARPAMGKTALAANIAFHAADAYRTRREADGSVRVDDGAVVAFFSLEMSAEQLATRMLGEQAEVPSEKIRRGALDQNDFNQVVQASQRIAEIPLFIDDTPALTISALRTRARRLKRTHGLGLIVVDYLQLLRPSGRSRIENRVLEISEITQGLKALAKELEVPVLALSQLSRAVENREDKRPQLSDLRESGAIEQDADVVMFLFREEYYHERKEPEADTAEHAEWQEKGERIHGIAELIIGKQRHGPTGMIKLQFRAEFTKFNNLATFAGEDDAAF